MANGEWRMGLATGDQWLVTGAETASRAGSALQCGTQFGSNAGRRRNSLHRLPTCIMRSIIQLSAAHAIFEVLWGWGNGEREEGRGGGSAQGPAGTGTGTGTRPHALTPSHAHTDTHTQTQTHARSETSRASNTRVTCAACIAVRRCGRRGGGRRACQGRCRRSKSPRH